MVFVAAWTVTSWADVRGADAKRIADELVRRWAPVYVQHVSGDDAGADRPTRIDFDGDWDTTNNWRNQARYRTALPPAAYSAGILSPTHAYLTYTLYYPRDWRSGLCISFICHDNDLETVMVVIERDGGDGRLVEVRAKAHLEIADIAGADIARSPEDRPLLRVDAEGHGITVCRRGDARCSARPGRIVYAPSDLASSAPGKAVGQVVRYALLPLRDTLWTRRHLANAALWTSGETGPLHYAGRRIGRLGMQMGASMAGSEYRGGVRPPWAIKGALGTRGDWFLDPAAQHAATTRASTRYDYNPFLDDLAAECVGPRCTRGPRREPTRAEYWIKIAAPYVLMSLGVALVGGQLRRHAGPTRSAVRRHAP